MEFLFPDMIELQTYSMFAIKFAGESESVDW